MAATRKISRVLRGSQAEPIMELVNGTFDILAATLPCFQRSTAAIHPQSQNFKGL
jgi:hypothetical protein